MRTTARVWAVGACVALASVAPGQVAPLNFANPLAQFGRLDQKAVVTAANPNFGRWACGPTSLVNSMVYLENAFPVYNRSLIPDSNLNGLLDQPDMIAAALSIAGANYMNMQKGVPPGPGRNIRPPGFPLPPAPYDYDIVYDSNPGNPGPGVNGGVTWERFAFGKDCWFARQGVPATTLSGEYVNPWGDATIAQPGWLMAGVGLNPNNILAKIAAGADVEVGFTWDPPFGGHFVTAYGYNFNNDVNGNGIFNMGESAILQIIDPWALPAGAQAPAINATMTWNLGGSLTLAYLGGASMNVNAQNPIQIWASELAPSPATCPLLLGLGALAMRRRRTVGG